jgi:hypothetical protein
MLKEVRRKVSTKNYSYRQIRKISKTVFVIGCMGIHRYSRISIKTINYERRRK